MMDNGALPELPPGWSWSVGRYSLDASDGRVTVFIDNHGMWIGNRDARSTEAPIEVVKAVISAWESRVSLRNT